MEQTNAEILEEIRIFQTAIKNIALTGQSYTIGSGASSRTFTAADIDKLRRVITDLRGQLDSGGGGSTLIGF